VSELPDVLEAETLVALREGLRRMPVPEPSPDFDARVLRGALRPAPWPVRAIAAARAVAVSGACAAVLTGFALHWFAALPQPGSADLGRSASFPGSQRASVDLDLLLTNPTGVRSGLLGSLPERDQGGGVSRGNGASDRPGNTSSGPTSPQSLVGPMRGHRALRVADARSTAFGVQSAPHIA